MVQNIYPRGVIWIRLMWENQKKNWQQFRPYTYKEVHGLTEWSQLLIFNDINPML